MRRDFYIKKIEFLYRNNKRKRKIKVTLSNGTEISIISCYESYEQYGGTVDELRITQPIAERYITWLRGDTDMV